MVPMTAVVFEFEGTSSSSRGVQAAHVGQQRGEQRGEVAVLVLARGLLAEAEEIPGIVPGKQASIRCGVTREGWAIRCDVKREPLL